jgi:hypothetical protein
MFLMLLQIFIEKLQLNFSFGAFNDESPFFLFFFCSFCGLGQQSVETVKKKGCWDGQVQMG